ncbi:MAG: zinc-dependent peptidase [Hydrogenophaga sp.]|nr:zinc-dependent peptidase [Hydrogenophaga sp.]
MIDLVNRWLPRRWRSPPPIPEPLWRQTLAAYPFLARLEAAERKRLRWLSSHFLLEKEFHPANGLSFDDGMALAIAVQACLPLLYMHAPSGQPVRHPLRVLDWYDDFVGIVVQPGAVLARRKSVDGAGVVHHYNEVLAGEAMDRGPIMLSWDAVQGTPEETPGGSNVVIHEFVHKMDMRNSRYGDAPDGAPPLPDRFMGTHSRTEAGRLWRHTMEQAYEAFREAVLLAERFGGEKPWLDDYAATHPAEFFAVTSEAYFLHRDQFANAFPSLLPLYDGFFRPGTLEP